jgi:hypothetical protein
VLFILGIEPLMHYYILLVPFLAIIVAHFFVFMIKKKNLAVVSVVLATCYLLSLILFDYGFLKFLSEKGGLAGDYGSGYEGTAKNVTNTLKEFKGSPNYNEIYLYGFLPIEYLHGYMPIGKMIYPQKELQQKEAVVEKQFITNPNNPLAKFEVFAYYTQNQNPSWDYVVSLREKSTKFSALSFIYKMVLDEYLSRHYKRLYETTDFLLLYPQHWSSTEIDNSVQLSDDSVKIIIKQQKEQTPDSILVRSHYYAFTKAVVNTHGGNMKQLNQYATLVLKEIMESVKPLP